MAVDKVYVYGEEMAKSQDLQEISSSIPSDLSDLQDDSEHRIVTDDEKTTWNNKSDFSGSYNDLTNKPIIPDDSELLHYKGHCATSSDLPSLGQSSYPSTASSNVSTTTTNLINNKLFTLDNELYSILQNNNDANYIMSNYNYYIIGVSQDENSFCGIGWNVKDQVKIKLMYDSNSSIYRPMFQLNYDASNPVYRKTFGGDGVCTWSTGFNGQVSTTSDGTISRNIIILPLSIVSYWTNTDIKFVGNATGIIGYNDTTISASGVSGFSNYTRGETLQITDENYIYGDNMILLKSSVIDTLNLQFSETTTKLNDVYTVGSNYAIYRRNENIQWEIWGQQNS